MRTACPSRLAMKIGARCNGIFVCEQKVNFSCASIRSCMNLSFVLSGYLTYMKANDSVTRTRNRLPKDPHNLHDSAHIRTRAFRSVLCRRLRTRLRHIFQHFATKLARKCTALGVMVAKHPLCRLDALMRHHRVTLPSLIRTYLWQCPLFAQVSL